MSNTELVATQRKLSALQNRIRGDEKTIASQYKQIGEYSDTIIRLRGENRDRAELLALRRRVTHQRSQLNVYGKLHRADSEHMRTQALALRVREVDSRAASSPPPVITVKAPTPYVLLAFGALAAGFLLRVGVELAGWVT